MNFKRILPITIFLAVLIIILSFITYFSFKKEVETSLEIQKESEQALQALLEKKVLYKIKKGETEILEFKIIPSPDSTVFSLLKELSEKKNFEISYKIYPEIGVFVESIAGLENGRDGKYWQYWVNDELPMVAADKFQVKGNDIVEWKFEIPQF